FGLRGRDRRSRAAWRGFYRTHNSMAVVVDARMVTVGQGESTGESHHNVSGSSRRDPAVHRRAPASASTRLFLDPQMAFIDPSNQLSALRSLQSCGPFRYLCFGLSNPFLQYIPLPRLWP